MKTNEFLQKPWVFSGGEFCASLFKMFRSRGRRTMGKRGPAISPRGEIRARHFPIAAASGVRPPPTKFDHHQILAWVEKSIGNSINHTHQAMY